MQNASRIAAATSIARRVLPLTLAIAAVIPAPPALANMPVLSMTVSPNRAAVGEWTCFEFQLKEQSARPVSGAEIVLEGTAGRTNRQGRARICTRLDWPGRHFALALERHYRLGTAMIQARAHGLQSGAGNWIYVQYYLAAYGGDGHCNEYAFGDGQWGCDGHVNATNDYYKDTPGTAFWRQQSGSIFFQLYTRITENAHYAFSDFEGYVPTASSDQFYVEQAYIDVDVGFHGRGDCPADANYGCLVSGTDPTKTGQPGGPLHLNVEYHHPFL